MAMETSTIVLIIGGVLGGIFLLYFVSTYNRMIRMRNEVDRAWSNIDVLLQQRYDMIPNLVNVVKGYTKHEEAIFGELIEARKVAAGALSAKDVGGVIAAETVLGEMVPRLFAISEDYPDLKADSSFVNLQEEMVSIENQVSDRREFYNAAVTNWNTAISVIPANFVASTMGAKQRDMFRVDNALARKAVKVEF
ncbi:MAG: hypothetical protein CL992_01385 [Euryarchaeota archaeon]|nr:hypothetical protein [Euryarchaeota archaeon]